MEHEIKRFSDEELETITERVAEQVEKQFLASFQSAFRARTVTSPLLKFKDAEHNLSKAKMSMRSDGQVAEQAAYEGFAWGFLFSGLRDLALNKQNADPKNEDFEKQKQMMLDWLHACKDQLDELGEHSAHHRKLRHLLQDFEKAAQKEQSPFADLLHEAVALLG